MGTSGSTWETPAKKDVARALLLRGSIFLHLDPRADGVAVPPHLAKQPQLILQIGLDMPTPILDLRVDDAGMCGTLSFNRSPFECRVPWPAVFAMQSEDGRMMLWPDSLPTELRAEVERELGRQKPPGLQVIQGGAGNEESPDDVSGVLPDNTPDEAADLKGPVPRPEVDAHGEQPEPLITVVRTAKELADDADARADDLRTAALPIGGAAVATQVQDSTDSDTSEGFESADESESTVERPVRKSGRELPPYLRVIK